MLDRKLDADGRTGQACAREDDGYRYYLLNENQFTIEAATKRRVNKKARLMYKLKHP